jgi:CelD/BcsL family acetyltransferase involved in cellulose biosynthesis
MEPSVSAGQPIAAWRGAAPEPASIPTPTAHLTVEHRRDLDFSQEDAGALDRLIEDRPQVGIFLSQAWLSGLFAEPPDGWEPSVAILRQGGALRGVLPLAVRRTFSHARVTLLGGGAGSDRVDLLSARGFEAICADTFLCWLADSFGDRGFVLELRDVPGDSPLWGALHRAGAQARLRYVLEPREIYAGPYLDLVESRGGPGRDGSAAWAPTSLEKHRRWLERRGQLRVEILHDPREVLAAFDSLVGLLHVRWRDRAEGSALDDLRIQRFHRHVLPLLLDTGRLRMIRLFADMRTIAVFYGLAAGGWWGYYLAGYDREWAGRIHLGRITLATAIDLASQQGATEFDFLKGAEPVKYLWPVRERVTVDADIYTASSGPQLARATRAARQAVVALVKSTHHLFSTHR